MIELVLDGDYRRVKAYHLLEIESLIAKSVHGDVCRLQDVLFASALSRNGEIDY